MSFLLILLSAGLVILVSFLTLLRSYTSVKYSSLLDHLRDNNDKRRISWWILEDMLSEPDWFYEYGDRAKWLKLSAASALAGLLVVAATGLKLDALDVTGLAFFATINTFGLVTVAIVQSFTDIKLRTVDRTMLNACTLLTGVPAMAYAIINHNSTIILLASIMLIFAGILILFGQSLFGASDARAMAMLSVGLLPVIGWSGFIWGSFVAAGVMVILSISIRVATGKTNASIPAVPLLLVPYWLTALVALFMELSLATPQLNLF